MWRLAVIILTLGFVTLQPGVAHACRVLPWEVRSGETRQSALMRLRQEQLMRQTRANVILARVVSAEHRDPSLHVEFETLAAVRGAAPGARFSAEIDNFCYPAYEWRAGESAILYLAPGSGEVVLAVPPRQNIDPTIAQDLRVLAATLRRGAP